VSKHLSPSGRASVPGEKSVERGGACGENAVHGGLRGARGVPRAGVRLARGGRGARGHVVGVEEGRRQRGQHVGHADQRPAVGPLQTLQQHLHHELDGQLALAARAHHVVDELGEDLGTMGTVQCQVVSDRNKVANV